MDMVAFACGRTFDITALASAVYYAEKMFLFWLN